MSRAPHTAADAAWHALVDSASRPYRDAGARFAYHFARGKLQRDPVFRALLERGLLATGAAARVVDIGCGQALLPRLLAACHEAAARGAWPPAWPAPPRIAAWHGIELMARDVQRAEAARRAAPPAPFEQSIACADMREAALPAADLAVILDVLHYVDHAAQAALLARVHTALATPADRAAAAPAPRGRLLLRVGDAARRRGFAASQWVDRIVTGVRGHAAPPTWGRPLDGWHAALAEAGFEDIEALPMSQGTPFANVLLVAHAGFGAARMPSAGALAAAA